MLRLEPCEGSRSDTSFAVPKGDDSYRTYGFEGFVVYRLSTLLDRLQLEYLSSTKPRAKVQQTSLVFYCP